MYSYHSILKKNLESNGFQTSKEEIKESKDYKRSVTLNVRDSAANSIHAH